MKEIWSNNYGKNETEGLQKWLESHIKGYKRQNLRAYIIGFSVYIGKPDKSDTAYLASNNFSKWRIFIKEKFKDKLIK